MNKINFPPTLRRGSRGTEVKWLQSLLISAGATVSISGDFDSDTLDAVSKLQSDNKLVIDGVVGPNTWTALLRPPVSYKQMDPRWAKIPYTATGDTTQTIGSSGCGPASMAMIVAAWRDARVTPVQACEVAVAGKYRTRSNGTAHSFFPAYASQHGLRCRETKHVTEACAALQRGALVVANMGPGQFTKGGHFIVLWAYDDYSQVVYVADPGSSQAARTRADRSRLAREAKKYFVIER